MGFGKSVSAQGGKFTSILRKQEGERPAGAFFHEPTTEGVDGAVARTNKNGRVVYELIHPNISGLITKMWFKDSKFGKSLCIVIDGITIQLGTDDKFFTDFAKKFPKIDLKKEVLLYPFFFEAEGKERTGISVQQGGKKLQNYYYDGKKSLHNFPEPEGDKNSYESDDWKIYFMQVKKFLIKEVEKVGEENKVLGKPQKFDDITTPKEQVKHEVQPGFEEGTDESLPF